MSKRDKNVNQLCLFCSPLYITSILLVSKVCRAYSDIIEHEKFVFNSSFISYFNNVVQSVDGESSSHKHKQYQFSLAIMT